MFTAGFLSTIWERSNYIKRVRSDIGQVVRSWKAHLEHSGNRFVWTDFHLVKTAMASLRLQSWNVYPNNQIIYSCCLVEIIAKQ